MHAGCELLPEGFASLTEKLSTLTTRTRSGPPHWHGTAMRARIRSISLARRWDESRDGAGMPRRPQPLPTPSPAQAGESTRGRTYGGNSRPSEAEQNREHWNMAQRKRCGAAPSGSPRNPWRRPGDPRPCPACGKYPCCTENRPCDERCLECAVSAQICAACARKPHDPGLPSPACPP